MSDEVKAGQVWQSKNTGRRWEVSDGHYSGGWIVLRSGEKTKSIPRGILVDDYILVKDAP